MTVWIACQACGGKIHRDDECFWVGLNPICADCRAEEEEAAQESQWRHETGEE